MYMGGFRVRKWEVKWCNYSKISKIKKNITQFFKRQFRFSLMRTNKTSHSGRVTLSYVSPPS